MMRLFSFLAAAAFSLLSLACSHDKAPADPAAGPTGAAQSVPVPEPSAPAPLPDTAAAAHVNRKPTGLRDPDLLNDLPGDRQFEPTKSVTSSPSDGALITSPPPSTPAVPPAPPRN